jgi:hypothetical protein
MIFFCCSAVSGLAAKLAAAGAPHGSGLPCPAACMQHAYQLISSFKSARKGSGQVDGASSAQLCFSAVLWVPLTCNSMMDGWSNE